MALLVFFIGIQSGFVPPLETMTAMRYFFLTAVSVILLASGAVLLAIGMKGHKEHLYRNGAMLLLAGLILWMFVKLWDIASSA